MQVSEDRDLFVKALNEIDIPAAHSLAVSTVNDALAAAEDIGYPVILRSAFSLGGLGSGFANNPDELRDLSAKSLSLSPQVLIERSMKGWKELEYEVCLAFVSRCAQSNVACRSSVMPPTTSALLACLLVTSHADPPTGHYLLQHGELRPSRDSHGRLDRRGAIADAHR